MSQKQSPREKSTSSELLCIFSLIYHVYSHISSKLHCNVLFHVLVLEATQKGGRLGRLGLVEALGAYMANVQKTPMFVTRVSTDVNAGSGKKW